MPTGFKLLRKLAFVCQCVTYSISLSSEAEDVASLKDEHERGRGSMQARLETASAQDIIWWCEMRNVGNSPSYMQAALSYDPGAVWQAGRLQLLRLRRVRTYVVRACACMNVQCMHRHACIQACIRRFVCMLAFK